MSSMPALCLKSKTPEDIELIEAPIPEPGPGQVLILPQRTGICGSDVSAYLGKANFDWIERPRIIGHEFSGLIGAVGAGVDTFKEGDPVCAVAMQSCLVCANCRRGDTNLCRDRQIIGYHHHGVMATHYVTEARYVMPLRYDLGFTHGALIEPLSVASRCVLRNCRIHPGDEVIVSGPGIIGMLCAFLARSRGGHVTVVGAEPDREIRLKKAAEAGFATRVVGADAPLHEQLDGQVDLFIEASGAPPALAEAHKSVRYGGLISIIATYGQPVTLDVTATVRSEQHIYTTMGSNWDDFENAQKHLRDGIIPVEELVQEFAFEDVIQAFEASRDKITSKAVLRIGTA